MRHGTLPALLGASAITALAISALAQTRGAATRPAHEPTTRAAEVVLPLSKAIPQPIANFTLRDAAKMFPPFEHAPFATAGFNHFTLPFRYVRADKTGDPGEALAFAFLLSDSLDWTPGCYCARHAYFAFKRSRKRVAYLMRKYDKDVIKFLVNDWSATHGVGGELRRSKQGLAGTLEIFDRKGKRLLKTDYVKPRHFFDLLGDMTVDAMTFFGHKPSKALVEHLHKKRCKHHESLVDLGWAAWSKEKTREEFDIYRKILKNDPDFAEVRYWWANQKWWRDGDTAHFNLHKGLALKSYLTLGGVADFEPEHCPDKRLAAKHGLWLRQSEKLVGRAHPSLVRMRLQAAVRTGRAPTQLLERATRVAAKYPNDHWLVNFLGKAYERCRYDLDAASSHMLVAISNRELVGMGGKYDATQHLAIYLRWLGHNARAGAIAGALMVTEYRAGHREQSAFAAMQLARALAAMGQHSKAVDVYRTAFHLFPKPCVQKDHMAAEGAIAAALAGRKDIVDQVLRDRRQELRRAKLEFIVEAYRDVLDGKQCDPEKIRAKAKQDGWERYTQGLYLCCQLDLMAGKQAFRERLAHHLRRTPADRLAGVLFDAYDRRDSRAESASFYEAAEWLRGDDPWVKRAVADYRRRTKKPLIRGADELLKRLAAYKPIRWPRTDPSRRGGAEKVLDSLPPGFAAAAIRPLLKKGEFDKAKELALRYHNLATQVHWQRLRFHANHLVHRVQQARAKAGRTDSKGPEKAD